MGNDKKIGLLENEKWQNKARKDSSYSGGKVKNPGKRFSLELTAAAVKKVNQKREKTGINYARKSMMRCGLSLGVDGVWLTSQLFPRHQEVIQKYPKEFEGKRRVGEETSVEADGDTFNEANINSESKEKEFRPVRGVVINSAGDEALV